MPVVGHVVSIVMGAYLGPTTHGLIHGSHDSNGHPRPEYIARRWPLFERFTLRSLCSQTVQDFGVVLLYDHRLCIDDYLSASPGVHQLGDRFRAVPIEPIDFRGSGVERSFWLARPEEDRAILDLVGDARRIFVTHVDSDDALAVDHLARVRDVRVTPGLQAVVPTDGYVLHASTGRVRRYHAPSPPFFSLVLGRGDLERGYRPYGGPGHHGGVRDLLRSVVSDASFLVTTGHGANDSTRFEHGYGPDLVEPERSRVLARFGLGV